MRQAREGGSNGTLFVHTAMYRHRGKWACLATVKRWLRCARQNVRLLVYDSIHGSNSYHDGRSVASDRADHFRRAELSRRAQIVEGQRRTVGTAPSRFHAADRVIPDLA